MKAILLHESVVNIYQSTRRNTTADFDIQRNTTADFDFQRNTTADFDLPRETQFPLPLRERLRYRMHKIVILNFNLARLLNILWK